MFKHVAMWKFEDDDDPGATRVNAIKIKTALEELAYEIHGLVDVEVNIDPVPETSAGADIFVECVFEDREAYDDFLKHPLQIAVAKLIRSCMDEYMHMAFETSEEAELP